jgi:anti-sigma factor RsiW
MCDDPQGVHLTVFVVPLNAAATPCRSSMSTSLTWTVAPGSTRVWGYTVVGNLPPPELRRIAELVRRQLG